MAILIPIGSGKGGVGKTVFTANLGAALAATGRTVILVDLDLGGANLHTCLGVRNKHPGVGSMVWKKEKHLEALVIPTGMDRLFLIPGDNLLPGTANLEYFTKRRIIKELGELTADLCPGGSGCRGCVQCDRFLAHGQQWNTGNCPGDPLHTQCLFLPQDCCFQGTLPFLPQGQCRAGADSRFCHKQGRRPG
jgi:hypothetical protein